MFVKFETHDEVHIYDKILVSAIFFSTRDLNSNKFTPYPIKVCSLLNDVYLQTGVCICNILHTVLSQSSFTHSYSSLRSSN